MINSETIKTCNKCKVEKPLEGFFRDKKNKSGRANTCKACENKAYSNYSVSETGTRICSDCEIEKDITEFGINRHNRLGRYLCCKICRKPKAKEYRANNAEKIRDGFLAYKRRHYEKHRLSSIARVTKYQKNHPDRVAAREADRRAYKLNATPKWANRELIKQTYTKCEELSKETGVKHHVDHIVPLKGKLVSGLHVENNLQILPASENCRKNNNFIPE